jgi:hypothetical protein
MLAAADIHGMAPRGIMAKMRAQKMPSVSLVKELDPGRAAGTGDSAPEKKKVGWRRKAYVMRLATPRGVQRERQ